MSSQIAAQLYTIREFLKTPSDIATSLKKVRDIGYEAVQLSGHGPIDPTEMKKILDDLGLTACITHRSWQVMTDSLDELLEEHRILDCPNIAVGSMPGDYRSLEGVKRFAKEASEIARKAADAGFTWSYHNHSFEFAKENGKTLFATLFQESDPAVLAEIDTYWVQHGGADPAQWISDLKGRIKVLHVKDMAIVDGKPVMAEVGEGNLNWPRILNAAKEAGVEWYAVEQDVCQRDPFESLAISFRNLKGLGLQ